MKPKEQMQAMMEWLAATAHAGVAARFDVGIGDAKNAPGSFFLRAGQQSLTVEEIIKREAFYRAVNARGLAGKADRPLNLYITAAVAEPQSWLLMDDLPDAHRCREIAGPRTHMIVETSPGSYHLWLATSRAVSAPERKTCQQVLQGRFGGDAGSVSGDHFGRIAGFKNVKRGAWVNLVDAVITNRCANVDKLLDLALKGNVCLVPQGGGVFSASSLQGVAPQVRAPSFVSSASPSGDSAESHKEFKFACESLRHRIEPDAIVRSIAERAFARGKRRTLPACEQYARKTIDAAARALAR